MFATLHCFALFFVFLALPSTFVMIVSHILVLFTHEFNNLII